MRLQSRSSRIKIGIIRTGTSLGLLLSPVDPFVCGRIHTVILLPFYSDLGGNADRATLLKRGIHGDSALGMTFLRCLLLTKV